METILSYPIGAFEYNGEPVFPSGQLYEGCKHANVIVGDLDHIFGSNK